MEVNSSIPITASRLGQAQPRTVATCGSNARGYTAFWVLGGRQSSTDDGREKPLQTASARGSPTQPLCPTTRPAVDTHRLQRGKQAQVRGQRAKCLLPCSSCTFLPQAGAVARDTPSQAPWTPLKAETSERYAPAAVGQRTVHKSCSISREVHNPSAKAAGAESKEADSRRQRAQKKGRRARRKAKHHRSDIARLTQSRQASGSR